MRTGKLDLLGCMRLDAWLALLPKAQEFDATCITESLGTRGTFPPLGGGCGATLQADLDTL